MNKFALNASNLLRSMKIESVALPVAGAALLTVPVYSDSRGCFEVFWEDALMECAGIRFKPENAHHSYNTKSATVRAFHYQKPPHGQAKLVSCVSGRVWDVMVDLRPGSPTQYRWAATELVAGDGRSHYIPHGCAHGFATLEDHSTVAYLIEGAYVAEASAVVRWNDPSLAVPWPVIDPILSDKDRVAPILEL